MVYGRFGEGQRVTKTETPETESTLKVEQKRILTKATMGAFWWLLLAVLFIGPDAGVILGYVALAWAAIRVQALPWEEIAGAPVAGRVLLLVLSLALGCAWYWWSWPVVTSVWPPVWFVAGRLYLGGKDVLPFPTWLRVIVLVILTLRAAPEAVLAIEMFIEMFDSNWPPTYAVRDPSSGPWMPGKRYRVPGEELRVEELKPEGSSQVGVRLYVPITEHTDMEAIRAYGREDSSRRLKG